MRCLSLLLSLCLVLPRNAAGQGIAVQAGRLFDTTPMTGYRVSWLLPPLGVLSADLGGAFWQTPGASQRLYGFEADASLFRGGRPGVYMVGGVGAGIGAGGAADWRSWSAGLGYELLPVSFMSLGVEGRWRAFMPMNREGLEFSLRLGANFGGGTRNSPPSARATPRGDKLASGASAERSDAPAVLADVIEIAQEQLGTRYQYGGEGQAGDGFDCSGLIQYAYGQAGIALPRRSVDQARAGIAVERSEGELRPGDILTFAQSGRRISHVGLYLGDGRFIHSASKGVQISRLGTDDPNGAWWYRRWVGVRRIVTEAR
jgi:cell wall-associated NlpC family hydrolase